ncbi:SigE family RNA polymerase sigma factor [Amycolatopsis cihanbeyliensis]|uniref:RNA polymerase sigma factor n=1 Tax=Amycolatopsis cihanbeyliensis TaxID=1128664 RepID=A0A542DIF2_AMYCI|nr:SigE family RNA polymerase sigma factor [Amycolatopsis cihanbeyliensis]TQJ02878.1 RNA polymerase sigma-70 factor (sigma-E family) [Amycolatopsis cihanbeyliensis]
MQSRSARDREFAEFFEHRFDMACRYAYALCGNRAESEEIAQAAFVRIYPRWPKVRKATADAYLRTVVTRLFLDNRRRGRSRERVMAEPPEVAIAADLTEVERQPLHAALLDLPPRQRAVVLLRFGYDLSLEQVAKVLGCSVGTVKSQASRGLDALRERYQGLFGELEGKAVGRPCSTTS